MKTEAAVILHHVLVLVSLFVGIQSSSATRVLLSSNDFSNVLQLKSHVYELLAANIPHVNRRFKVLLAAVLSLAAASVSSAGGLGGGGLFVPILNLVAGLDLKTSTAISAFMVTGGSVSNVIYCLPLKHPTLRNKPLIDYDIALLSQPCMLLGVSLGVICNVMFPEWLITVLLAIFLACSTATTCRAALRHWKVETEASVSHSKGGSFRDEDSRGRLEEPLLEGKIDKGSFFPFKILGVLVLVWVSFFVIHLLRGDQDEEGLIHLRSCRTAYWMITCFQIPLAFVFTVYILFIEKTAGHQAGNQQDLLLEKRAARSKKVLFPLVALSSGFLAGLFGIGGGMLMNPVLLQMGVSPQVTAATSSFMVSFSASMSAVQYLLLGIKHLDYAFCFAAICFVSAWLGLLVIQNAIRKYGRSSLIIFSVSTVMAVSTVFITGFGALDVWRDYSHGKYMGFKLPC